MWRYRLWKVGIWTRHGRWHATIGPLSGSAISVPTPSREGGGWQSTGASLWVYKHVTTRQELAIDGFPASPHSIRIPHLRRQGPCTYEAILLDHPQQRTVFTKYGLPNTCLSPNFRWQHASGGRVDGRMSQTQVTSDSALPHALRGKCKHFMPITYRGWTLENHWELRKIWYWWFEVPTMRRQICMVGRSGQNSSKVTHIKCNVYES